MKLLTYQAHFVRTGLKYGTWDGIEIKKLCYNCINGNCVEISDFWFGKVQWTGNALSFLRMFPWIKFQWNINKFLQFMSATLYFAKLKAILGWNETNWLLGAQLCQVHAAHPFCLSLAGRMHLTPLCSKQLKYKNSDNHIICAVCRAKFSALVCWAFSNIQVFFCILKWIIS